ncbi:hypothetical protein SNE40_005358 [Patella caerulea]|uniref:SPRY domain-containing SOCS box protein 3 n=2 Tax=Patella caerulea TaxID=87958 RepID=A0AAN8K164_PATCE
MSGISRNSHDQPENPNGEERADTTTCSTISSPAATDSDNDVVDAEDSTMVTNTDVESISDSELAVATATVDIIVQRTNAPFTINRATSLNMDDVTEASSSTQTAPNRLETDMGYQMCMARPVRAETFCDCVKFGKEKSCKCGEDDRYFDWVWDEKTKSPASQLIDDGKEVAFHLDYSCGTAAVRGNKAMAKDQYFWEVKMTSPVYGTDMMIGVGTEFIDLTKYQHKFCSLIGQDAESWGLSYTGTTQHRNQKRRYASKFGQGSIIGAHLDMWRGTLTFYKNRKPLGVAYTGLQGKVLYPMVSSTAARSGMKVITSRSFKTSLQFMCCQTLRKIVPHHMSVLDVVRLPPGLRGFLCNNISWLLQPCADGDTTSCHGNKRKRQSDSDASDDYDSCKKMKS